jgi:DNA polymerase delta subunit 1
MTSGDPLLYNPAGGGILGSTEGPVPIVRMYGVSQSGYSVMACIHGYTPYFFASIPSGVAPNETYLASLRGAMDQRVKERARGDEKKASKCVLGIERIPSRQSLLGYQFETSKDFLKIYVAMPSMVPSAKRIVEEGLPVPNHGQYSGQTYESNVPYVLRYVIALIYDVKNTL